MLMVATCVSKADCDLGKVTQLYPLSPVRRPSHTW